MAQHGHALLQHRAIKTFVTHVACTVVYPNPADNSISAKIG
jgi:hypothetical protein